MRRVWLVFLVLIPFLLVAAIASLTSPPTLEEHVTSLVRARVTAIEDQIVIVPTSTGTTGSAAATGPTPAGEPTAVEPGPGSEPATVPFVESLDPVRTPAESASASVYDVGVVDMNGDDQFSRFQFETSEGWEFYDRLGYSCVSTYLQWDGERVARLVFRTADGVPGSYAGLNDRSGNEQNPDRTGFPSRCAIETPHGEPETEVEDKPAGLLDSVVSFQVGGREITRFVCSAGSHLDPDTWCEFEEEASTPNHVTVEIYWRKDLIVVVDIDRMSPDVEIEALE